MNIQRVADCHTLQSLELLVGQKFSVSQVCSHSFQFLESLGSLLKRILSFSEHFLEGALFSVLLFNSCPVVIIRLISGDLQVLERFESSLVEILLRAIWQGFNNAHTLADLSEPNQSFIDLIHSNAVINLIVELFQLVGEMGAFFYELRISTCNVIKIDHASQCLFSHMLNCRWLVVSCDDLMHKRDLGAQEGQLFDTSHLKTEYLVVVPDHVFQGHVDRH